MPFTFSHPALIFPIYQFGKKYFSLTGLVIGSIAPDFEYFLQMNKGVAQFSHNLSGLFWFDIPFSIVLALVYHNVIRNPLINSLPVFFFRRFFGFLNFNWNNYLKHHLWNVCVSVLVGSASHLCWDWAVHNYFHILSNDLVITLRFCSLQFRMDTYSIFHNLNSLLGFYFSFYIIINLPIDYTAKKTTSATVYWLSVLLLSIIIVAIRLESNRQIHFDDLIVTAIAAFLMSLLVASLLVKQRQLAYYK
jgi:hypothetical protein